MVTPDLYWIRLWPREVILPATSGPAPPLAVSPATMVFTRLIGPVLSIAPPLVALFPAKVLLVMV